jgi:hypothetical protein
MSPDLFPSDRHLTSPPEESIFSTSSKRNALEGCILHWAYLSEAVWANELHAQRTRRFWALWTSTQEGILASFSPDLAAVFALAPRRSLPTIGKFEIDSEDKKLTMRVARAREIPRWMPSVPPQPTPAPLPSLTNLPTVLPIPQNTVPASTRTQLAPLPPSVVQPDRTARPVVFAVGLMWEARADVDLYLRIRPGANELFFGRVLTPQGRYIHDFQDRNVRRDYEWAEIWEDVDISQVEAWINLFEGAGPIQGTVCLFYKGNRYQSEFSLPAVQGNRGADGDHHRATSPQWCRINLPQILASPAQ